MALIISLYLVVVVGGCMLNRTGAAEAPASLEGYLESVLAYNEQLEVQIMDYEISRQAVDGARGAFEPEFVLRTQYDDTLRPNNAEEIRDLGGLPFYKQRSMLYSAAVEALC